MNLLTKTAIEQEKIDAFLEKSGADIKELESYSDYIDLKPFDRIRKEFKAKTDDFNRDDRKLNIGIIGQVKAGKSTFLNTLLFDGKEILPSARTPKTATLTKIEHSEENQICIEYYNEDEWKILEDYAKTDIADNEHIVAREIMGMVEKNGVNPSEYLKKGSDVIGFDSSEALMGKLNEYVGENGIYTPFVKIVTIKLDIPELKEISVIDTPGLNDAISSRTAKTQEFIANCDVVFFLSRASAFLDSNDMKLVTSQLPSKGVNNLVLICSQFDSGIMDVMRNHTNIRDAAESVKKSLTMRANEITEQKIQEAKASGLGESRIKVFEQCRTPILVSSLVYNMSKKEPDDFSRNEAYIYKRINKYGDLTKDAMQEIGNFDVIKENFSRVISEKDVTLQKKAADFMPNVKSQWNEAIDEAEKYAKSMVQRLETGDRETIKKQKNIVASQISGIKSSLETVLGELLLSLESHKTDCLRKLRENCRESSHIEERQGTEWHTSTHKVTTGHFFWKKTHYEVSNYSTTYTYLAASDALENVRGFGLDACSDIESVFMKAVDVKNVKRRLMQTILDNFDSSDETFDVNYFRHIAESTLNQLEFPVVKIDIEPFLNKISSKFSGEVKNSAERSELQSILADSIDKLYNEVTDIFTAEVSSFKIEINNIKNSFSDILLENINTEFEKLQNQFMNKEQEILKYKELISIIVQKTA